MKLSGFLNKPRWQAKEAAVRRAGVAEDDEAELLAGLAGIARADPDPGVRTAALKRLADPAEGPAPACQRSDWPARWFAVGRSSIGTWRGTRSWSSSSIAVMARSA